MKQSSTATAVRGKKKFTLLSAVGTAILETAVFLPCLSFLFSLIAYKTADPTRLIPTMAYIAALMAALFCGFLAARLRGGDGLFCGLLAGGGMVALFLCALFVFSGGEELSVGKILFTDAPVFLLTLLGALIGGAKRATRRGRRIKR